MKIKSLLLLLFLPHYTSAQIILKGKILDDKQQPIQSVSITLSKKNSNIILAYSISDKNGFYKLSWNSSTDSLKLNVSALGYGKREIIVSPISAIIDFTLTSQTLVLKEVKVQQLPVWERKDTINYNVSEFKQQQDRVIGDIIARSAGYRSSPDGQYKI